MSASCGKISVLVVDDSAFMRKVISDILSSDAEIEVVGTAKNGEDGIQKARMLKPQIITLDVEMPVMNGIEAFRELRNDPRTSHLPVIMLTAVNEFELSTPRDNIVVSQLLALPAVPPCRQDHYLTVSHSL